MKSSFAFDIVEILAGSPTKRWAVLVAAAVGIYWIGIDSIDFYDNHFAPWFWPLPEIPN